MNYRSSVKENNQTQIIALGDMMMTDQRQIILQIRFCFQHTVSHMFSPREKGLADPPLLQLQRRQEAERESWIRANRIGVVQGEQVQVQETF